MAWRTQLSDSRIFHALLFIAISAGYSIVIVVKFIVVEVDPTILALQAIFTVGSILRLFQ